MAKSCKELVSEWCGKYLQSVTDALAESGIKVTNDVLANMMFDTMKDTGYSWETFKKWVTVYRREGLVIQPKANPDILRQITENRTEAIRGFGSDRLDTDPLGLTPEPEIDIKSVMFDVPDSYSNYQAPIKLDGYGKKFGIVSDIHFPIHDRGAVLAAHSYLKKENIDCLILLGDIMDTGNLTRHDKWL